MVHNACRLALCLSASGLVSPDQTRSDVVKGLIKIQHGLLTVPCRDHRDEGDKQTLHVHGTQMKIVYIAHLFRSVLFGHVAWGCMKYRTLYSFIQSERQDIYYLGPNPEANSRLFLLAPVS